MKRIILFSFLIVAGLCARCTNFIRVNQVGYLNNDVKVAVMIMSDARSFKSFTVTNAATGKKVKIKKIRFTGAQDPFAMTARLDFSQVNVPGEYFITAAGTQSQHFKIGNDVYAGAQEIPLFYMRQQRCGYNPFLQDSCHTLDGRLVLSGKDDGKHVDVTGGWHDASDFLQYLTTSANAVYQMLFAYSQNPGVWQDNYKANGDKGSNGIPDILDEAKWGIDWMIKMNPNDSLFLNQIADDRDHRWAGLPQVDNVDYGWGAGKDRPVFPCADHPYGLRKYMNKSRGLASSVGKFCSSFSIAAQVFEKYDAQFAQLLRDKAANAYKVAQAHPGNCQTACTVSPYYYEEDNWVDDMELAAMGMYDNTRSTQYLDDAVNYGRREPVTPWMGADSARHYQWYPFVNLGHALIAMQGNERQKAEFLRNMRSGIERVADRATGDAFMHGIPYIWCSNNLTVGFITQAMLYRQLTGDKQFQEIETAMRDWLFGVNPWGKCMIIGLPEGGDFPKDPHSTLSNIKHYKITGGLVDGPVYTTIFKSLRGVTLRNVDAYAPFQSKTAVYHDDYCDYSTNEPTMDGTASTTWFLSQLASGK
jgi:hypothetical protein